MNIKSFSQTDSKPKIIIDSNSVEMLAFNSEQLKYIKTELLVSDLNKKINTELKNKIHLLITKMQTQEAIADSLQYQINTYVEITKNKDGQITAKEKEIKDLKMSIDNYEQATIKADSIISKQDTIITSQKNEIKNKNKTIFGLIVIDIIIIAIAIF